MFSGPLDLLGLETCYEILYAYNKKLTALEERLRSQMYQDILDAAYGFKCRVTMSMEIRQGDSEGMNSYGFPCNCINLRAIAWPSSLVCLGR
jgi:hypothetical protein